MAVEYDVAIIGAGASGLTAARELCAAGLRVALVEARDRMGGRIYTLHPPDLHYPIELGAEFVHGTPAQTWELLDRSGLTAYEIPDSHWMIDNKKLEPLRDFWDRIDRVMGYIDPKANRDLSFRNYLDRTLRFRVSRRDKDLARAFVEGFQAAHADRISVKSLVTSETVTEAVDITRVFRISQGYDRLLHWIWKETSTAACSVILNNPISEIRWERGSVELLPADPNQDPISAKQLIVTVPLGVLNIPEGKPGHLKFSPGIVAKTEALGSLEMGQVIKLVLRFNHVLWEELGFSRFNFIHSRDENAGIPTWWNAAPFQVPVLTGWAGGPAAESLSGRTEQELREVAILVLSRMFSISPSTLERGIEGFYSYDWQKDPFSRGAYSYVCVGGHGASQDLAAPIDDTLFFAGEATLVEGLSGTVEGAIATGRRAAREVIATEEREWEIGA